MIAGFATGIYSEQEVSDIHLLFQNKGITLTTNQFPAKELNNRLVSGEVDLIVSPLVTTPVKLPEGIVIAAVTGSEKRGFCLICQPETMDNAQTLFIKKNISISVDNVLVAAQLAEYRPDAHFTFEPDIIELLERWKEKKCESVVIPVFLYAEMKDIFGQHEIIPLHPREIVPPSGHGATAFLTLASHINIRKTLQSLHQPNISALTNIERKVQKLLDPSPSSLLGVYCESPRQGQFRVSTFFQATEKDMPIRTSFTSTTTFELAELVVRNIQSQMV